MKTQSSTISKILSTFLTFFLIVQLMTGIFEFGLKPQNALASSGWLSGWDYRTPIIISGNTESLSDHQVKITLQGTNPAALDYVDFDKVLLNGADLRITDSDKTTELPYWIESWDDSAKTATVWVKVPSIPTSTPETTASPYFKFTTYPDMHDNYGLSYPITYEFNIPAGSSNLTAYKKFTEDQTWTEITEKTSNDFFNGIEAVRFDHINNKAYVSIAFDANSDEIYLKITNINGAQVATYSTITEYYDNRKAAAVFTADDWENVLNSSLKSACDAFTSRQIWLSPGIETGRVSGATWSDIQAKIDAGYIEPVSHSRTHPVIPYSDYDSEIGGSKDDIIENLDLPALNKKGSSEYVYAWTAPQGIYNASIRNKLGIYKYLVDVSGGVGASGDPPGECYGYFPGWDPIDNLYNKLNRYHVAESLTEAQMNSRWDADYAAGKIYHLGMHPSGLDWSAGSKILNHLDYIKDKKDVWYAGIGHLFLYHLVKERGISQKRIETSGYNVYLYYGKAGVSSTSNFDNVFVKDYGESGLVGLWHMDDQDQSVGSELLIDGGLETWTTTTDLTNWVENATSTGVRDIIQESEIVQSGSHSVKLEATSNNGTSFYVYQDIDTINNAKYQVSFYYRYASRTQGVFQISVYDKTNNVNLTWNYINTTSADFVFGTLVFTSTNTTDIQIRAWLQSETTGIAYVDTLSVRQAGTLADSSGNSNNGAVYGASRTDNDGGQWGGQSDVRFSTGSALQFNGINDYVDAGNAASLNNFGTGGITVEAWIYATGTQNKDFPAIVEKSTGYFTSACSSSKPKGFWLIAPWTMPSGNIVWGIGDGNGNCAVVTSVHNQDEFILKWHHIVGIADDQSASDPKIKLYLDGALVNVGSISFNGSIDVDTVNLNIGRWRLISRYFQGSIDEVRLYNRALSAEEVLSHYQRRLYASPDALASVDIPFIPTIATPTVLSSNSIRWNFTDNADNETGFRVYTNADAIATSSATANLTYLDETGLSENTQYTRYVKAYNSYGESTSSSVTSTYTLADTPTGFGFLRHTLSLDIYVDRFPNDTLGLSGYLFWRTDNSAYNSGWIQTNEWQGANTVEGQTYTYAVKYRNGDGVETATTTLGGVSLVRSVGGGGTPTIQPQTTTSTSSQQATSTSATSTQINATTTPQTSTSTITNLAGLTDQVRQIVIQQIKAQILEIQKKLIELISQLIQLLQEQLNQL